MLTEKQKAQFDEIDALPDSALIETNIILLLAGISRPTLAQWVRKGTFPKPLALGGNPKSKKQWRLGELRKALGLKRSSKEVTE
jgi:hypothetical protein